VRLDLNTEKDINLQPASFYKRFIASVLDIIVSLFGGLLIAGIINMLITHNTLYFTILFMIFFPISYFSNVILYQIISGRSIGKFLFGLKICYPNNKIDVRNEDIVKREFSKLVTYVTACYSFFSKYKEEQIIAFHDDYSQTVILNLTEDHEKYLHEHYYEEYFHTKEEEEEYSKLKQDLKDKIKDENKYKKQLKKEQKDNIHQDNSVLASNSNIQESSFNPEINENNASSFNIESKIIEKPLILPVDNQQNYVNNEQEQLLNSNVPNDQLNNSNTSTHSPGVNIVGNYDFLDQGQVNNKNSFTKLTNIFKNKSKIKDTSVNREINYVNNKLSILAQDDNYLPSENIFSEQFKGWALTNAHQDKLNKVTQK
jgi:hypothetical protein